MQRAADEASPQADAPVTVTITDTLKERAARKLWAMNENGGVDDVLKWSQLEEWVHEEWLKDVDVVVGVLTDGE